MTPRPYFESGGIVLYHGDCRDILAWCDDGEVLITDPPYGMRFVSAHSDTKRPIAGDETTEVRDCALGLWGATRPAAVFGTWKVPRPIGTRHRLIWDKQDGSGAGMGDLDSIFGNSDEEIYLLGEWKRGERTRQPNILRTSSGMAYLATNIGHPTPKPIDLMERLIRAAPPRHHRGPVRGVRLNLGGREESWAQGHRHRARRTVLRNRGRAVAPRSARALTT